MRQSERRWSEHVRDKAKRRCDWLVANCTASMRLASEARHPRLRHANHNSHWLICQNPPRLSPAFSSSQRANFHPASKLSVGFQKIGDDERLSAIPLRTKSPRGRLWHRPRRVLSMAGTPVDTVLMYSDSEWIFKVRRQSI